MGSLLDCLAFQPLKLNAGVSLRLFYASPLASANWVCSGGEGSDNRQAGRSRVQLKSWPRELGLRHVADSFISSRERPLWGVSRV